MRIAIIGGGFTGLAAAYELTKHGHQVTVFEKEKDLGGLAFGFKKPSWEWHLEYAYHHWFTNDRAILSLVAELGIKDKLIITRPVTATLWKNRMYQLDSPLHLLLFPGLSLMDKFRTALLLGLLKLNPFWQPLERITAEQLFTSIGGQRAWQVIWKPLLYGKFGDLAPTVAASWLWARVKKRTPRLVYIEGGFQTLIAALDKAIKKNGGAILTETLVQSIQKVSDIKHQVSWKNQTDAFDRILLTVPTPIAAKLVNFPEKYINALIRIPHLHAQTLILETNAPILKDVYWLNVTDRTFPFLAAVAHTNFMDKAHYGGHHLTYFGNYLPQGHRYLSMNANQILKIFLPYIQRLSPNFKFQILNFKLFTGPFAQPVHQLHYSSRIPPIQTPITGIYLANMDFIFPWDRGTNYAVELGETAAKVIMAGVK